jgi:hypothetical protein
MVLRGTGELGTLAKTHSENGGGMIRSGGAFGLRRFGLDGLD